MAVKDDRSDVCSNWDPWIQNDGCIILYAGITKVFSAINTRLIANVFIKTASASLLKETNYEELISSFLTGIDKIWILINIFNYFADQILRLQGRCICQPGFFGDDCSETLWGTPAPQKSTNGDYMKGIIKIVWYNWDS